jgi:hypothetical protein
MTDTPTKSLPPPPPYVAPHQVNANHANATLTNGATGSPPPNPPSGDIEASATPNLQTLPPLSARADSMVRSQDVSADPARPEGRDAKGRFAPGNSGRPKGARSRLITQLEQAMELAAPEIVRILIGRAQCGDGSMEAAKYILERVASETVSIIQSPRRRGRAALAEFRARARSFQPDWFYRTPAAPVLGQSARTPNLPASRRLRDLFFRNET